MKRKNNRDFTFGNSNNGRIAISITENLAFVRQSFKARSSLFFLLLIIMVIVGFHGVLFVRSCNNILKEWSQESQPDQQYQYPLHPKNTVRVVSKQSCSSFYSKERKSEYSLAEFLGKCSNCLSQGNQDEILDRIFSVIGETNRQCVEFGFGIAKATEMTMKDFESRLRISSGLNTHSLIARGWKHTFFDAEIENLDINLYKRTLTGVNIASVFKDVGIPKDVDYVSIDIDSVDVWVLKGLLEGGYRPRVLSVEYNQNFPRDMLISCEKEWAPWQIGSRIFGASAGSINMVAEMFGYQVVEIMPFLDMFFVRKDILSEICIEETLPTYELLTRDSFVGKPTHESCALDQVKRLVDFPLALQGLDKEAKEKAMKQVRELNEKWIQEGRGESFCDLSGLESNIST